MSRRLWAIMFAHRTRNLPNLVDDARVIAVWEGIRPEQARCPEQAAPLMRRRLHDGPGKSEPRRHHFAVRGHPGQSGYNYTWHRSVWPMTSQPPSSWVDEWLSPGRFAVYIAAAGGDRDRGLEIYERNATASAAFEHDLGHLEVALRNAYDAAITAGTPTGQPHWTLNATALFPVTWRNAQDGTRFDVNRTPRDQIDRAVRDAGAGAPPGKVIAELTFGFWRYLSTAAHDYHLWVPLLHKGLVAGTSRKAADQPIGRLHKLRNRVAHHESLLRQNLAARHQDVLTVASLISTDLHTYLAAHTTCPALIAARP